MGTPKEVNPPNTPTPPDACEQKLDEAECELRVARVQRTSKYEEALAAARIERLKREESEQAERAALAKILREEEARRRGERRDARRGRWRRLGSEVRRGPDDQEPSGTLIAFFALSLPALAALIVFALSGNSKVLATGLFGAAAAFTAGALLGFLFGVPRSIAGQASEDGKPAPGAAAAGTEGARYLPNTNLEQISDWLTKILVGLGLVQIHEASGAIDDLASGLAPGLGGTDTAQAVAVAILISFSIAGFITAYLFTRLRLQGSFEWATAIRKAAKAVAAKENNTLALVHDQLDPGADDPPLDKLTSELKAATLGVRTQAFYLARDQRRINWKDGETELVAPVIPVFRALIACDPKVHRNHAELGYALKDQTVPDYAAAKAALELAISLRPKDKAPRFYIYEYNLAYCEIKLAEAANRETADDVVESVVGKLMTVVETVPGIKLVKRQVDADRKPELVWAWLGKNSERPEVKKLKERLGA